MAESTRRVDPQEVSDIRNLLRKRGVRATPARIAVMQELRAANSPLTHADLAEKLVPLGFDKATVFRNLTDLSDAELIARTELGDHVWRFEALDPDNPGVDRHPHFVCVECGGVTCLGDMEFTTGSKRRAKTIGRITEILIKGHCSKCEERGRGA
jgi:Fur family ferric uptake transcriptional regulator